MKSRSLVSLFTMFAMALALTPSEGLAGDPSEVSVVLPMFRPVEFAVAKQTSASTPSPGRMIVGPDMIPALDHQEPGRMIVGPDMIPALDQQEPGRMIVGPDMIPALDDGSDTAFGGPLLGTKKVRPAHRSQLDRRRGERASPGLG